MVSDKHNTISGGHRGELHCKRVVSDSPDVGELVSEVCVTFAREIDMSNVCIDGHRGVWRDGSRSYDGIEEVPSTINHISGCEFVEISGSIPHYLTVVQELYVSNILVIERVRGISTGWGVIGNH